MEPRPCVLQILLGGLPCGIVGTQPVFIDVSGSGCGRHARELRNFKGTEIACEDPEIVDFPALEATVAEALPDGDLLGFPAVIVAREMVLHGEAICGLAIHEDLQSGGPAAAVADHGDMHP